MMSLRKYAFFLLMHDLGNTFLMVSKQAIARENARLQRKAEKKARKRRQGAKAWN